MCDVSCQDGAVANDTQGVGDNIPNKAPSALPNGKNRKRRRANACAARNVKRRRTRRGRSKRKLSKGFNRQESNKQSNNNNNNNSTTSKLKTDGPGVAKSNGNASLLPNKQPLAPYNTNQFLIEDHGGNEQFDQHIMTDREHAKAPTRTRNSSFSVDEDADAFYSSPEDEEEFLTKEFSNTYQDMRSERLSTMTREQLIQECVQLETRLELMAKCLAGSKDNSDTSTTGDLSIHNEDESFDVKTILLENEQLRRENEVLRRQVERSDSTISSPCASMRSRSRSSISRSESLGSVDSESDSSSMDSDASSGRSIERCRPIQRRSLSPASTVSIGLCESDNERDDATDDVNDEEEDGRVDLDEEDGVCDTTGVVDDTVFKRPISQPKRLRRKVENEVVSVSHTLETNADRLMLVQIEVDRGGDDCEVDRGDNEVDVDDVSESDDVTTSRQCDEVDTTSGSLSPV